jgi:tetratricopeptide (TPR) repeat protein
MNRRERRAQAKIESSSLKGPVAVQRSFVQALRYHQAGQLQDAERLCLKILAADPRHAESLHLLGLVAARSGQIDRAAELIGQALSAKPSFAEAHNNLGITLRALGRHEEALSAFGRALELTPKNADVQNSVAVTLAALGRQDEALAASRRTVDLDPGFAKGHYNLGRTLQLMGRHEQALAAYRRAIELEPEYASAHNNLGVALQDLGRNEAAAAAFRRALELQPDYADASNNLGVALRNLGRLDEAEAALRRAIELKADYAEAYNNLGALWQDRGKLEEAAGACRRAIELQPGYAAAYTNLGNTLKELGRTGEALALYDRAASLLTRGYEDPWVNKAVLLIELGRVSEALEATDQALAVNPRSGAAWHARSELKSFCRDDPDIERMESLLAAGQAQGLRPLDCTNLAFALGKAWMDAGDPDRAFAHFNEGNRRKRATILHDAEATSRWLASVSEVITPHLMSRFAGAGHPSDVPIFVVGMPRSGTTLVEQILASHPEIEGAGELWALQAIVNDIPQSGASRLSYPQVLRELSPDDLTLLGSRYVERVVAWAPGRRRVVDKMPTNFQFAGLIHLMLPNARIIHCRREAMDTCLSCYTKNLRGGARYSFDLRELGMFYRSYEALMAHWRESLPPERFTEVFYEDVVSDLEAQARRLFSFCGMEWNEACLAFHETRRQVRTISAGQVRRPLYRTSVGRWMPYAKHLGPLLAALGRIP